MKDNYIKRGDVFYANLNPVIGSEQKGERPVVVVQNNLANKHSPTLIVVPITAVIKKDYLPTHILIKKNKFLKYNSMILVEQIRVVDKLRLKAYLGRLDDDEMKKIDNAIIQALSLKIKNGGDYEKIYSVC